MGERGWWLGLGRRDRAAASNWKGMSRFQFRVARPRTTRSSQQPWQGRSASCRGLRAGRELGTILGARYCTWVPIRATSTSLKVK